MKDTLPAGFVYGDGFSGSVFIWGRAPLLGFFGGIGYLVWPVFGIMWHFWRPLYAFFYGSVRRSRLSLTPSVCLVFDD